MTKKIEDIDDAIQESVIKTQSFVTQLGNMALYYARTGEKEITMYIIDELNRSKAFANAKNVIQTVHIIDKELDRIEEVTNTW